jgi:hypothetical protein
MTDPSIEQRQLGGTALLESVDGAKRADFRSGPSTRASRTDAIDVMLTRRDAHDGVNQGGMDHWQSKDQGERKPGREQAHDAP